MQWCDLIGSLDTAPYFYIWTARFSYRSFALFNLWNWCFSTSAIEILITIFVRSILRNIPVRYSRLDLNVVSELYQYNSTRTSQKVNKSNIMPSTRSFYTSSPNTAMAVRTCSAIRTSLSRSVNKVKMANRDPAKKATFLKQKKNVVITGKDV